MYTLQIFYAESALLGVLFLQGFWGYGTQKPRFFFTIS